MVYSPNIYRICSLEGFTMNETKEPKRRSGLTSDDKSSGKTIAGVKTAIHAQKSAARPSRTDEYVKPAQDRANKEDSHGHKRGRLESPGKPLSGDEQHYSFRGSREGMDDPTFENEGAVSLDQPLDEGATEVKADYEKMVSGRDSVDAPEPTDDLESQGIATRKAFR